MIKDKIKKEKGISLISLVIAIVVLVVLTNIIIYVAKDNLKVGKLKEMQNDIKNLRDKVSSFYATNGKIPAKLVYDNQEAIGKIKDAGVISDKVDTGNFLVIDLSALENLTLNRGQDYKKVKDLANLTEEAKQWTDLYIINEASHNIFYVAGITIDDETFYTDYGADEVDNASVNLRYVDNVRIPEGFYYAGGSKAEGLVISDVPGDDLENTKQGNQFVWVPVENIEDFHTVEGYRNNILQEHSTNYAEPFTNGYPMEQNDYNNMVESVKNNQGFYIGRFEAGKEDNGDVVIKKGANVYNKVPWGNAMNDIDETSSTSGNKGAVKLSKDFATTNKYTGVTTTLCYGVQWDATMQFMDSNYINGNCAENSYVRNSAGRGHYGANSPITTGSNPDYAEKNIYDMAGNIEEWTMEAVDNARRTSRGGYYGQKGNENPASYRGSGTVYLLPELMGFRIALYLNENEASWSPAYDKQGIYKDKNGDTAYIPKGFQVSKKGGEDTINEGLVVRDSNKNEFVWIPVNDIKDFHRINAIASNLGYFNTWQEPYNGYPTEVAEYNTMKSSVEKYKGFYIGRYEAGKASNGSVIVKRGVTAYNNVPWGNSMTDIEETSNTNGNKGAVKLSKEFGANNKYQGIVSTLCYDVQWDAILQFMDNNYITGTCTDNSYVKNSVNRGFYSNSSNPSPTSPTTTGSKEEYAEKNIYDMAGNLWEWTMAGRADSNNEQRTVRGGCYRNPDTIPALSMSHSIPNGIPPHIGFRIALYLEDDEEENWSSVYDKAGTYQDKNGDTA